MKRAIKEKDKPATTPITQRAHGEDLCVQSFFNSSELSSPKEQALRIACGPKCQTSHRSTGALPGR